MAQLLAGADSPTVEEVADALWMAGFVCEAEEELGPEPVIPTGTGAVGPPPDSTAGKQTPESLRPAGRRPPRLPAPGRRRARDKAGSAVPPHDLPMHPVSTGTVGRGSSGPGVPGAVVRVPGEPALSESLAISRALRPLKRRVASSGARSLDETATATASGEASMLMPTWLPRTERWLSVDLVVDTGPSMVIWRQLAAELRTLLEGQGAFRTVRTWSLESGGTEPRLSVFRRATGTRPKRDLPWKHLADPTGRHLLLILTDGVGPLWRRGGMEAALRQWSRERPVAVLQVLPRSLWHRTGLTPVPVAARPAPHGRTTPLFRGVSSERDAPPRVQRGGWVPVLELDAEWIAPWAQVVSGRAAGWTPLLALRPDSPGEESRSVAEAYDITGLDASSLVEQFRGEASQSAFELAGYLAATPLVLPVMRLVQRVMMPRSKPSHLAELFLSGLLSRSDEDPPSWGEDPDLTLYDFRPGVRDVLLSTLTRQESLRTLDVVSQVSGRVAQRLGGNLDFRALIPSPGARSTWRLPVESLPFARTTAKVLAGLGEHHRSAATALAEQIDAITSDTAAPPSVSPPTDSPATGSPAIGSPGTSSRHRPSRLPTRGRVGHAPMLFVGLGGTGGLIGAELERKLRSELCGPDGAALHHIGGLEPHQLPDHLQFVYADFSESDLLRLPQFNVDPSLRATYARTSRATHNLLPNFDSSPEVTQMLRASLRDEDAGWLPPQDSEPRVTPLRNGAGQLPTVGRAALFATLRHSLQPVLEPLLQAIDAIAKSGGSVSGAGGGRVTGCDVFVAFSVAGGTGAGIFLDYLHLIDHAFKVRRFNGVKIYPLVMMPSSFPAKAGGGREAELNAARSLVDLFRLVDGQNAPTTGDEVGDLGQDASLSIRYPDTTPVRLRIGTLPTAFLFSPTAGIRQDDLRRSIASLVMSLNRTGQGDDSSPGRTAAAGSFVDRGTRRSALSLTGIGRRGVSTCLVASMEAPLDQLADLVAGRLLRVATIEQLTHQRNPVEHVVISLIRQLFVDSQLERLWECPQLPVEGPQQLPQGGRAIEEALNNRIGDMHRLLTELRTIADRQTASMAAQFNPRTAIDRLLGSVDPFLAEGLVRGRLSDDPFSQAGFLGMLDGLDPMSSADVDSVPPGVPRIRDRLAGLAQARWDDENVRTVLRTQDDWYRHRSRAIWHAAWRKQQQHWRERADTASADLTRLVDAFRKQADQERKLADHKRQELYEERTGISYLLPPQRTLNHFYEEVITRLVQQEGLREGDGEGALLTKLVDAETWRSALARSLRSPDGAVADVRTLVAARVMPLFTGEQSGAAPLLPPVSHLLSAAAGDPEATHQVTGQTLDMFARKLTGLLPVGFTPEGTGPLRVLVTHPPVQAVQEVRDYLGRTLLLPSEDGAVEYREVESESIDVVLLRTEMALTEVPEARNVLRQWARAKDDEQAQDVLRWRQRLGYEDDWMISSEEDRRTILHRLLCCMWNGQVDVLDGDTASPSRVRLRLFPEEGASIPGVRLRLGDFPGGISSWSELLRAYEHWTVLDDRRTVENYCSLLLSAEPLGLTRAVTAPHPMFVELVEHIAPRQLRLLRNLRNHTDGRERTRIRPLWEFWARTLPAALDVEFRDPQAVRPTLRELSQWAQAHPDHHG
ncbi:SAV_2336 N-terminal domain-related protein [Streptomyces cyaneofuscatus]|uniref:SAV_2336 N-terminal domain-related protein n=1 Tax=Streptomyces cyaneofuscatus TaxID=66883 RepID=UPI0038238BD1